MADRPRALPPWMERKTEEKREKEAVKRCGRKRGAARPAFYCMNERELVEVALSVLTGGACRDVAVLTGHKVDKDWMDKPVKAQSAPEPPVEDSPSDSDSHDRTYVSETDLDITEVETLPYTTKPDGQFRGQRSANGLSGAEKEERGAEPSQSPTEEDDPLRLVREIFFT